MLQKTFVTKLHFRYGKTLVEDCKHSDHPSTNCKVGKTEEVSKIITEDQSTISESVNRLGLSYGTIAGSSK
jgi:hypothetical protein